MYYDLMTTEHLQLLHHGVFMCVCVLGDKSDRRWFPVASSSELSHVSAPVDAGLLAEGEDGEAELHSDPQRSQQNHTQPRQHRLIHTNTQVHQMSVLTS